MPGDLFVNALAGGLSGVAVDSVLFPLDTIKTRLQARRVDGAAKPTNVRGFYRGLLSAMLGSFPSAATFWTAYQAAKSALTPLAEAQGWAWLAPAGAAAAADVAVCAVRNPFEVVKQQMQTGAHASSGEAVRTILRVDGWRGLYAGYGSTVLREIPFDALEFVLYERMKRAAQARRGRELVLWENAALGSIAGGFAAAVTTPLDVVKTRLMTQTKVATAERYRGVLDALRRIPAEEGAAALFSGIRPRVAWISVGGAIFIGSFEEAQRRLRGSSRGGGGESAAAHAPPVAADMDR